MSAWEGVPLLDHPKPPIGGLRIRIEGSVQGVGFRPWVHGLAHREALKGRVWNDSHSVTIEVFGEEGRLSGFLAGLRDPPMPAARIVELRTEPIPPESLDDFAIVPSSDSAERRPSIPPDLATCPDCLREVRDPTDRRYGYAFTNCTRCGPRYTIATDVPYDRERTTMAPFMMCEACRAEYEDVDDRRFHAQPNACPQCGPRLQLVDGDGVRIDGDPIAEAATLLRTGLLVAVKGLGGYHLACDARNETAVAGLRARKRRYAKPFAVMAASIEQAEQLAHLRDEDRDLLLSPVRPIVLTRRRSSALLARERRAGFASGRASASVHSASRAASRGVCGPARDDARGTSATSRCVPQTTMPLARSEAGSRMRFSATTASSPHAATTRSHGCSTAGPYCFAARAGTFPRACACRAGSSGRCLPAGRI